MMPDFDYSQPVQSPLDVVVPGNQELVKFHLNNLQEYFRIWLKITI